MKKSHPIGKQNNDRDAQAKVPQLPTKAFMERYSKLLFPACIAVIIWVVFQNCSNALFTNWDDPGYITNNPLIRDCSWDGIKNIFSTTSMGNYHPLTIISYAIEYSFTGLQPRLYHTDNLVLHILVTLLVYWFVMQLTRRTAAAVVTSLLFALHPMHVEPVAWIADRKDLLYTLFFMWSCIAYVYYVRAAGRSRFIYYLCVLLLFVCAILSKPVAITLPVVLFIIDYFEQRKWHRRIILEKLPLLCLSIAIGVISIRAQQNIGAINVLNEHFTIIERLALGGYAFIMYLWKALVPVSLCNFYPYPLKVNNALPLVFYLYPAAAAALLFIVWKYGRKNRIVIFGTLFFVANIALLLQVIPVGSSIISDRYTYLPYFGLFFIAGWYVSAVFEPGYNKMPPKLLVVGATVICLLTLGYLSNARCCDWYDSISLWSTEVKNEPLRAPDAWNNLGSEYADKFKSTTDQQEKRVYFDSAFYSLNKAIESDPSFTMPYIALGSLMRNSGRVAEARSYYYQAIALAQGDKESRVYLGLANICAMTKNFDSSGYFFRMALQLNPNSPAIHTNLGNLYDMTGKPDSAIAQYTLAISQNPDLTEAYVNRSKVLQHLHRFAEALPDLDKAVQISPTSGDIFYARSFCHYNMGNKA